MFQTKYQADTITQYWVIHNLPLHVKWPVASDLQSFDQLIHKICVTWLRSTQVTNIPTNFEVDISMQHWKTLSQTLELLVRLLDVAMATTTQLRSALVWGWLNHPVLSYDVSVWPSLRPVFPKIGSRSEDMPILHFVDLCVFQILGPQLSKSVAPSLVNRRCRGNRFCAPLFLGPSAYQPPSTKLIGPPVVSYGTF